MCVLCMAECMRHEAEIEQPAALPKGIPIQKAGALACERCTTGVGAALRLRLQVSHWVQTKHAKPLAVFCPSKQFPASYCPPSCPHACGLTPACARAALCVLGSNQTCRAVCDTLHVRMCCMRAFCVYMCACGCVHLDIGFRLT